MFNWLHLYWGRGGGTLAGPSECSNISWDCAKGKAFLAALSELAVDCKLNRDMTEHGLTTYICPENKTGDI